MYVYNHLVYTNIYTIRLNFWQANQQTTSTVIAIA